MAYSNFAHTPGAADVPAGEELISDQIWDQHPENPYNWSNGSKAVHVMMLSLVSFLS